MRMAMVLVMLQTQHRLVQHLQVMQATTQIATMTILLYIRVHKKFVMARIMIAMEQ
jgi:hypothetical protein